MENDGTRFIKAIQTN